jgi:hypothetical protein
MVHAPYYFKLNQYNALPLENGATSKKGQFICTGKRKLRRMVSDGFQNWDLIIWGIGTKMLNFFNVSPEFKIKFRP